MNPPAEHPGRWREALARARLYAILDLGYVELARIVDVTARLLDGGADILQLRAKGHPPETIAGFASRIQPLCASAGVPLIINDHPGLVGPTGADGFHIGQDGGSLAADRELAGPACLAGRSTHSPEQASAAISEGADYIGFGPLHTTPTKPGRPAIGLQDIAAVMRISPGFPVFCIGGINANNLGGVLHAGARRVVIVSDLLLAGDITARTHAVRKALEAWPLE